MSAAHGHQGALQDALSNDPPLVPGRLSLRSRLKTKVTTTKKLFSSSKHSKPAIASTSTHVADGEDARTSQGRELSQTAKGEPVVNESVEKLILQSTQDEAIDEESVEKVISRPIFELWDEAYEELAKKEKHLIADYEVELSNSLGGALASSATAFSGLDKIQRSEQMQVLLTKKIQEVDDGEWKLKFKDHELKVKDLVTPVVGVIEWAKDFVGKALEPSPYGSIAWAGVCLLLPLVLNPSKQEAVRVKGLDHISTIISRCVMREALYQRRYESTNHDKSKREFVPLHVGYRDALRALYVKILNFQAASVCFLAKNTFSRVTGDMATWNNWDSMLDDINEQENILESAEVQWRDMKYDEECQLHHDRHEQRMRGLNAIEDEVSRVRHVIEQAQMNHERKKLLEWLSSVDPSKNYNSACKDHAPSTGDWLVKDSRRFKKWEKTPNSFFWLYGPAGSGKSFLSASVIHHLQDLYNPDPYIALAYFYFSFDDTQKQNTENMLRSVIVQLCGARPDTPKSLLDLQSYRDKNLQPSLENLEDTLKASIQDFKNVYLVIDAIDECPFTNGEREQLLKLLGRVQEWRLPNLHVLCTSRPESDIMAESRPFFIGPETSVIDIQKQQYQINTDIGIYIDQETAKTNFRFWSPKTKQDVKAALMEKANGMFLYAALQLEALQKADPSPAAISEALADLPEGLDETYNRALSSIAPRQQAQAIRALKWLAFSIQPLTVSELAEASIIDPKISPSFYEKRRYPNPIYVLELLPGLVTVVSYRYTNFYTTLKESVEVGGAIQKHHIVRLAHLSIKEYLMSDRIRASRYHMFSIEEIPANIFIAETCLICLLQFDKPDSVTATTIKLPLVAYAARYWTQHARLAGKDATATHVLIMDFFLSKRDAYINWLRLFDPDKPWSTPKITVDVSMIASPLYYASHTGLIESVSQLLENGEDVNAQDEIHSAAMNVALKKGHDQIAQLLLEKGAELESKDISGYTPLLLAAESGREATTKMLLEKGAQLDSKDEYGQTPLSLAAIEGNGAIIKLLLEKGAELESKNKFGFTPLSLAASDGNETIVKLLLEKGAELESKSGDGSTPLTMAAVGGHEIIVKLLLEKGAEIESKDSDGQTPLSVAVEMGNEAVVKLLLEKGAEVESKDNNGQTPLLIAAYWGQDTIVDLLLEKGAELEPKDNTGRTPLSWATYNDSKAIAKLLLKKGAKPQSKDIIYSDDII